MPLAEAESIFVGQDFYVPHFQVKIAGRPQGQGVIRDILSVSYKDNIKEIDTFEININNWDAERRAFKYSDSDLFNPGKELELWMGYYGKERQRLMIRGTITALRPSFPSGGGSTLGVSGLNVLHKLRDEQRTKVYEDMTDTQIAKQIEGRLGVTIKTDGVQDATRYDYIIQDNEYDIIFLMQRARRIGYDLLVEEEGKDGQSAPTVLLFKRSVDVRQVTYQLTYGRTLIEFKPELTTANQVGEVTVRGWDSVNKKKIEYTAKRADITVKSEAAIEQAFKQRKEVIATKPIQSEDEAKTLATRTLEEIAKDMVKGSGSTVGLTSLRAGSVLRIDGLGERFSGRYFVTGTTHSIGDGGYTTQFDCRREEV
jgi:phage protein D